METKSKHDEGTVVSLFRRKHDIKIDADEKIIRILRGKNAHQDLGNKSWGKIDFLQKKGYTLFHVTAF